MPCRIQSLLSDAAGLPAVEDRLSGLECLHDIEKGAWPANLPAGTQRAYELGEIRHWLKIFLRRFFTNQFKRSALPNGPTISLRRFAIAPG